MNDPTQRQAIVLDTPQQIELYHMRAQLAAVRLEAKGMRHSSGKSVCAFVKATYGFKTRSKADTAAALEQLIEDKEKEYGFRH